MIVSLAMSGMRISRRKEFSTNRRAESEWQRCEARVGSARLNDFPRNYLTSERPPDIVVDRSRQEDSAIARDCRQVVSVGQELRRESLPFTQARVVRFESDSARIAADWKKQFNRFEIWCANVNASAVLPGAIAPVRITVTIVVTSFLEL